MLYSQPTDWRAFAKKYIAEMQIEDNQQLLQSLVAEFTQLPLVNENNTFDLSQFADVGSVGASAILGYLVSETAVDPHSYQSIEGPDEVNFIFPNSKISFRLNGDYLTIFQNE